MAQRDIFIQEITKKLELDKDIYFLSADFGAPALDDLREKFPKNFVHCGISEQAMLDIATGLALDNKKVFVYAMAPFLSLRAIEQIKCGPGLMNLPISIISTGIGLGYADAGPTHYSTEDLACLRSLSGNTIYTPSDNNLVKLIVTNLLNNPDFSYIRLDRDMLPDIHSDLSQADFNNGYKIIGDIGNKDICLVSHGKMTHKCIEIQKKNKNLFCVDLFRSKPVSDTLIEVLSNCKKIICVDEQMPAGNLSSIISEKFMGTDLNPKILNVSLKEEYLFENGGREYLLDKYGLSTEDIINKI